jgi:threonine synthase
MTTVLDRNVTTVAVSGTFDDCQALVKRALSDESNELRLTAFNSINWARVMAQVAYYMWAAQRTGIEDLGFAVPTGNFGNVFSGLVAKRCGAPIGRLIIANNENHGLADLIERGKLELETVKPTVAPAMDIQLPSNLERYLFDLSSGDASLVKRWQEDLSTKGRLELEPELHEQIRREFAAGWLDDRSVEDLIFQIYDSWRTVVDPHTATAWGVGERLRRSGESVVTIATAHPAKFPEIVKRALDLEPELPPDLADLAQRPERYEVIPNEYGALRNILKRFAV